MQELASQLEDFQREAVARGMTESVLTSLVACALPAMRALQVEPLTALRSE